MVFGILTHLFERFCAGVAAWRDEHEGRDAHGGQGEAVEEGPGDWWEARVTITAPSSNRDGVWHPKLAMLFRVGEEKPTATLLVDFQAPPLRGRAARCAVAKHVGSDGPEMREGLAFELYMGSTQIGLGELIRKQPEKKEEKTTP